MSQVVHAVVVIGLSQCEPYWLMAVHWTKGSFPTN